MYVCFILHHRVYRQRRPAVFGGGPPSRRKRIPHFYSRRPLFWRFAPVPTRRSARLLPNLQQSLAPQAIILYLCGEVRVACDLWSWERTYVPTYFFFGFHLLSFSFLLFPNDHKEPGIHPQLTPAAAVLLVPPAPRTSWSRSIREYLLWTSSKIHIISRRMEATNQIIDADDEGGAQPAAIFTDFIVDDGHRLQ